MQNQNQHQQNPIKIILLQAILNWSNKEQKVVPSEKRNKNVQFIMQGVQKSTITNAEIDIGAETSVHELEADYQDIESIAHNNVRITEVLKASLPNIRLGQKNTVIKFQKKQMI